jgi:hypothetical protein
MTSSFKVTRKTPPDDGINLISLKSSLYVPNKKFVKLTASGK